MQLHLPAFIVLAIACLLALHTLKVGAQSPQNSTMSIPRTGWVATADSFQPGNEPSKVLDGNPATIWHTEYKPVNKSLPHTITLDMQNVYMVNGFSYLPRQDKMKNGNIGQLTIQVSLDSKIWTTQAIGTWANDQTLKTSFWNAVPARYVRLTAKTEAQGKGLPWTSAAELNVLTNPQLNLDRQDWEVWADSQQPGSHFYSAAEAIDGSPTTYWQTQFSPLHPNLPHSFTIDQGMAMVVGGLTYLPRPPSTGKIGNIGKYTIQYSQDNSTWTNITAGSWADTQYLKVVEFAAVSARYFRLLALTEAGNRANSSSASEINLLDGSTQLSNFQVTVDSEEIIAANNAGVLAVDSDLTTFWQTKRLTNPPGFPHYIIIDIGAQVYVKSLTYIPRQDGSLNGTIGDHEIDLSIDNTTWTNVEGGTFYDDATPKYVNFRETVARYVRLTAWSEAGNRGPWTSAAEVTLGFDSDYTPPRSSMGQWGHTINFPVVPVAAALIYSPLSVLVWASNSAIAYQSGPAGLTITATYNLGTGLVSQAKVLAIKHDMFCPGLSMDFKGEPFVTGGDDASKTSIFNPLISNWTALNLMNIPRGYQSSATMSTGNIFTIGGSWIGGLGNKTGEVYNFATGKWTVLKGCPPDPMLTKDAQGIFRADNHGWLFSWSNGTVFQAGPSRNMTWYTPVGYGGWQTAGPRADAVDAMNGNAVMFDTMAGQILAVGGSTSYQSAAATTNTYIITIGTPNTTANVVKMLPMSYARAFANGVALPDGTVFVVGGQSYANPFYDDEAILQPELFDPVNETWQVMAPMASPRCYHSIALLLPDATVISGGGGLCGNCSQNHFDAQIWSPPYLFNSDGSMATRPVILSVSNSTIRVGLSLNVTTDSDVTSIALMRMGSATHTVDTDQRRIALPGTPLNDTNVYSITIPSDPGKALPGYWMVFVLNSFGVPSISKTIKVTL